jgi:hypothetical protein
MAPFELCRNMNTNVSARNQVRRHRLYPGHYSKVFVIPENAQKSETKHQSKAVPILLLANCFDKSSKGVFCRGFEPLKSVT